MSRGDWKNWVIDLRNQLIRENLSEITLTIDEIVAGTKTTMTPESVRSIGFWNACREGREYFDTIYKHGISIDFNPNQGGQVETVTFRLAPNMG